MAEGLQSHTGLLESAYISKSTLERGKLEDLRVLWDALRPDGFLVVEVTSGWGDFEERLEKGDGETAWTRLCQIRDEPAHYWIEDMVRFEEMMLMMEAEGWDVQEEEDKDEEVEEEEEEEEGELGG